MRITLLHNRYLNPGGEDTVFAAERDLLISRGHEVAFWVEDNALLNRKLPSAVNAIWSRVAFQHVSRLLVTHKSDIMHVHNTFVRLSPAVYYAARQKGVPIVQTLHNYRLLCPGALLVRNGRICESCLGKTLPWPGVIHGCWKNSRVKTGVVAAMLTFHRLLGTWRDKVDIYIALTHFARQKFIEGGLPAEKIVVKPNFVYPDPGEGHHEGKYALFVGRLTPEKGARTLLQAWRWLKHIPLKIMGAGPLLAEISNSFLKENWQMVEVLGRQPRRQVFVQLRNARVLIFPSEWYEGFPMTIVEAFATGLPVIASRLGAMAEIIDDGRTGLLFEPGNPEDLAEKVEWAWSHPREMAIMGSEARKEYKQKYTAEHNYWRLMEIYHMAMEHKSNVC